MHTPFRYLMALLSISALGCNQGFKTAQDLEADERGPKACADACTDLGMHMSAFVLFEKSSSGCVCSPNEVRSADQGSTAIAGGYAVLQEQERQRQQQAQQQQAAASRP